MIIPRHPGALRVWRTLTRLAGAAVFAAACAAVCAAVAPGVARGQAAPQASIVPATHSVYDWLQQQRVFGRLPEYEDEERPMSRSTILRHLRTLQRDSAQLSATDRALLADYLNEFDFERLEKNGLFRKALVEHPPQGVIDAVRERRDPYLYAGPVGDSTLTAALWVRKGWGEGWSAGAGRNDYAYLWTKGVRAFVNSTSGFGFHGEVDLGVANDAWIYRLDPRLGVNERFLQDSTFPPAAYEAWVSYQRHNLFIAMGKGAASIGPAVTDPLVLRVGAPSLGQLRLTIGPPKLHLTFLQGQLDGDVRTDTSIVNGQTDVTRSPVQRWVSLTRITWNPTSRIGLTLHQMTVYSQRGIDFEYLNPLLPSLYGGLDKGDPDNGFVGIDAIARPLNGTELKYSVLIDDAQGFNFKPFGNQWAKVAVMAGLEQRLPYDIRLGFSYTRDDAYTYTSHVPTDAWEISGVPLGPQIGPNADEVAFRLTRWFPWRTRLMIGTRHIREGLDPVDAQGNVTVVGGNIGDTVDAMGPFLVGSDLQTYRLDEVEIESEPIRGFTISARMQSIVGISGTRVPGTHTWFLRWSYGF
jgi:hypothetical protein